MQLCSKVGESYIKVACGYLLARRLHFINRIFGKNALTDFSAFRYFYQRMFEFYKTFSFRTNKSNDLEIQALFEDQPFQEKSNIFPFASKRRTVCL